jgi:hypothetical protein
LFWREEEERGEKREKRKAANMMKRNPEVEIGIRIVDGFIVGCCWGLGESQSLVIPFLLLVHILLT